MKPSLIALLLGALVSAIGALSWICFHLPQNRTIPAAAPAINSTSTPAPMLPINTTLPVPAAPLPTPVAPTQPIDHPPQAPTVALTAAAGPAPAEPPVTQGEPNWKTVYEQHFDTADSLQDFFQLDGGNLEWHEKYKALFLHNDPAGGQVYAALHRSLPGDLRVRMRVLRTKQSPEINIGVLFSLRGSLKAENGYFAEWKQGEVQLKRDDLWQAGGAAATPATSDRWVAVELVKLGRKITLKTEGKEVATWTDEAVYHGRNHDLFSLYVWDENTLVDDLVIERNQNDGVEPMPDDPAVKSNAVDGIREDNNPQPDQF